MSSNIGRDPADDGPERRGHSWRRVLEQPRWLVGLAVATLAVAAFVRLGIWQLDRLDDRRNANAAHNAALMATPATLGRAQPAEFGAVAAGGTFLTDGEVLWVGRSWRGVSGREVLTPLAVDDGVVLVDRGWIALDAAVPRPPGGPVTVRGWWRSTGSGRVGGADPASGLLTTTGPDLEELGGAIGIDLGTGYIVAQELSTGVADGIRFVEAPDFGEGNHLSYAIQWFLFAAVVAVGFPLLVRHTGRRGNI